MKKKWYTLIVLLSLVVIFTAQNYATVGLRLLFWTVDTSLAILIFVTLLIGIAIGLILSKRH